MDTTTHIKPLQWIQTRARSGPTSTLNQAASWQWYELAWAVLVVALFGTTGRIIDFIAAGGLVVVWLAAPAIVVSIVGHLIVIGLEIFPEVAWAVVAMELLLIAPIIIELGLLAPSRKVAMQTAIGILILSGSTAVGVWRSMPVGQLGAILAIVFSIGVVVLNIQFGYTSGDRTLSHKQADCIPTGSNKGSIEQPSSSQEGN